MNVFHYLFQSVTAFKLEHSKPFNFLNRFWVSSNQNVPKTLKNVHANGKQLGALDAKQISCKDQRVYQKIGLTMFAVGVSIKAQHGSLHVR